MLVCEACLDLQQYEQHAPKDEMFKGWKEIHVGKGSKHVWMSLILVICSFSSVMVNPNTRVMIRGYLKQHAGKKQNQSTQQSRHAQASKNV